MIPFGGGTEEEFPTWQSGERLPNWLRPIGQLVSRSGAAGIYPTSYEAMEGKLGSLEGAPLGLYQGGRIYARQPTPGELSGRGFSRTAGPAFQQRTVAHEAGHGIYHQTPGLWERLVTRDIQRGALVPRVSTFRRVYGEFTPQQLFSEATATAAEVLGAPRETLRKGPAYFGLTGTPSETVQAMSYLAKNPSARLASGSQGAMWSPSFQPGPEPSFSQMTPHQLRVLYQQLITAGDISGQQDLLAYLQSAGKTTPLGLEETGTRPISSPTGPPPTAAPGAAESLRAKLYPAPQSAEEIRQAQERIYAVRIAGWGKEGTPSESEIQQALSRISGGPAQQVAGEQLPGAALPTSTVPRPLSRRELATLPSLPTAPEPMAQLEAAMKAAKVPGSVSLLPGGQYEVTQWAGKRAIRQVKFAQYPGLGLTTQGRLIVPEEGLTQAESAAQALGQYFKQPLKGQTPWSGFVAAHPYIRTAVPSAVPYQPPGWTEAQESPETTAYLKNLRRISERAIPEEVAARPEMAKGLLIGIQGWTGGLGEALPTKSPMGMIGARIQSVLAQVGWGVTPEEAIQAPVGAAKFLSREKISAREVSTRMTEFLTTGRGEMMTAGFAGLEGEPTTGLKLMTAIVPGAPEGPGITPILSSAVENVYMMRRKFEREPLTWEQFTGLERLEEPGKGIRPGQPIVSIGGYETGIKPTGRTQELYLEALRINLPAAAKAGRYLQREFPEQFAELPEAQQRFLLQDPTSGKQRAQWLQTAQQLQLPEHLRTGGGVLRGKEWLPELEIAHQEIYPWESGHAVGGVPLYKGVYRGQVQLGLDLPGIEQILTGEGIKGLPTITAMLAQNVPREQWIKFGLPKGMWKEGEPLRIGAQPEIEQAVQKMLFTRAGQRMLRGLEVPGLPGRGVLRTRPYEITSYDPIEIAQYKQGGALEGLGKVTPIEEGGARISTMQDILVGPMAAYPTSYPGRAARGGLSATDLVELAKYDPEAAKELWEQGQSSRAPAMGVLQAIHGMARDPSQISSFIMPTATAQRLAGERAPTDVDLWQALAQEYGTQPFQIPLKGRGPPGMKTLTIPGLEYAREFTEQSRTGEEITAFGRGILGILEALGGEEGAPGLGEAVGKYLPAATELGKSQELIRRAFGGEQEFSVSGTLLTDPALRPYEIAVGSEAAKKLGVKPGEATAGLFRGWPTIFSSIAQRVGAGARVITIEELASRKSSLIDPSMATHSILAGTGLVGPSQRDFDKDTATVYRLFQRGLDALAKQLPTYKRMMSQLTDFVTTLDPGVIERAGPGATPEQIIGYAQGIGSEQIAKGFESRKLSKIGTWAEKFFGKGATISQEEQAQAMAAQKIGKGLVGQTNIMLQNYRYMMDVYGVGGKELERAELELSRVQQTFLQNPYATLPEIQAAAGDFTRVFQYSPTAGGRAPVLGETWETETGRLARSSQPYQQYGDISSWVVGAGRAGLSPETIETFLRAPGAERSGRMFQAISGVISGQRGAERELAGLLPRETFERTIQGRLSRAWGYTQLERRLAYEEDPLKRAEIEQAMRLPAMQAAAPLAQELMVARAIGTTRAGVATFPEIAGVASRLGGLTGSAARGALDWQRADLGDFVFGAGLVPGEEETRIAEEGEEVKIGKTAAGDVNVKFTPDPETPEQRQQQVEFNQQMDLKIRQQSFPLGTPEEVEAARLRTTLRGTPEEQDAAAIQLAAEASERGAQRPSSKEAALESLRAKSRGGGRGGQPPGTATAAPEQEPQGDGPNIPGLRPGGSMVWRMGEEGNVFGFQIKQERLNQEHINRLKDVTGWLEKWGKQIQSAAESTEKYDKRAKVLERDVARASELWQQAERIRQMPGGTVEQAAQRQALLGRIAEAGVTGLGLEEAAQRLEFLQEPGGLGGGVRGFFRQAGGIGAGLGQIAGGAARELTSGWGLIFLNRMKSLFMDPVQRAAMGYAGQQLAGQQAMYMAGMPGGMAGVPAGILQAQAGMGQFRMGVGEAGWQAWGGLTTAFGGRAGALGPGLAIGAPAVGAGFMAAYLMPPPLKAPVGIGAALITAGIGAVGYGAGAMQDQPAMALAAAGEPSFRGELGLALTRQAAPGQEYPPLYEFETRAQRRAREQVPLTPQQRRLAAQGRQIMAGNLPQLGALGPEFQAAGLQYFAQERLGPQLPTLQPGQLMQLTGAYMGLTGRQVTGQFNQQLMVAAGERAQMLGIPQPQAFDPWREMARQMGFAPERREAARMAEEAFRPTQRGLGPFTGVVQPTEMEIQQRLWEQEQIAPFVQQFRQRWGRDITEEALAPLIGEGMGPQRFRMQQLMAGNRQMWSDVGRQLGRQEWITMEEGGLPIYTTEMRGVAGQMRGAQRGYRDWQWEQQGAQLTWQGQYMMGPQWRQGIVGGMWGLENQQRAQQLQQQQWQFGFAGRQFAQAGAQWQEQFNVGGRQWQESFQLGRNIFEARAGWQQQDIGTQQQRAETQFGWRMQDWGYQENVAQLQYGWQQEDIGQAIRFSSGRQRRQLQQQQERLTISESMRRQHHEEQKDRMEEQRSWQIEDFEKQKERNEELLALQRERFELQKRHFEENREMQQRFHEEGRQLGQERLDKQQEFYYAGRELEDRRIDMQRENWKKQYQWALDAHKQAGEYNEEMDRLQDKYREWQEKQADTIANFQKLMLYLDESEESVRDIVDAILRLSGGLGGSSMPSNVPFEPYQVGGPVLGPTVARLGEEGEEYVVPKGGALVKSDGASAKLLRQIYDVLVSIQGLQERGMDVNVSVVQGPGQQAAHVLSLEDSSYANWPR